MSKICKFEGVAGDLIHRETSGKDEDDILLLYYDMMAFSGEDEEEAECKIIATYEGEVLTAAIESDNAQMKDMIENDLREAFEKLMKKLREEL